MITKDFDSTHQILKVRFSGKISKKEMLEYFQNVLNDESMPRQLKILEDSRQAEFGFEIFENEEFRSLLTTHIENFKSIKAAHVQIKPIETAYTMEYEIRNSLPNFSFKVFYEYQNALKWLIRDQ